MKLVLTAILSLLVWGGANAQEPSSPVRPVDAIPGYFEYGDIRFYDEKAQLDHFASQLRLDPDNVIYIFVYAGRLACKGEAEARAVRARNYLVKKRSIGADRVIWKDGGFRENLTVELWLRSRDKTPPDVVPTVDPAEVKFVNDCKPKKGGRRGDS